MKRLFTSTIILLSILSLCACGEKKADDPLTKVTLGMTLEQAIEAEPALAEYEEKGYSFSKTYANAEGTMLISFAPYDEEETVFGILWHTDPTDGKGKEVYDTLFSDLQKAYGKPKMSNDKKDVESVTGIYDQAQALWEFKDYTVFCSYIEYHASGKCQIQYRKSKNVKM